LPITRLDVNGENHQVEMSVIPLNQPDSVKGLVLVVFESSVIEATALAPSEPQLDGVDQPESAATRDDVARLNAEIVAVNAELKLAYDDGRLFHEVLTATNEELQSTNDELTISMEEMQSMNEELQTLNAELEWRVAELTRASDDMDNLLACTQIAALFLDGDLRVRRFTPQVRAVINLRPSDIGRPFTELVSHLRHPELVGDIATVMGTSVPAVTEVPTDDGRWFSVSVVPYRARDGRIDGSVINLTDITAVKHLRTELDEARQHAHEPAIGTDGGTDGGADGGTDAGAESGPDGGAETGKESS
jgi:two-component system CheB/CheR fusion protein